MNENKAKETEGRGGEGRAGAQGRPASTRDGDFLPVRIGGTRASTTPSSATSMTFSLYTSATHAHTDTDNVTAPLRVHQQTCKKTRV